MAMAHRIVSVPLRREGRILLVREQRSDDPAPLRRHLAGDLGGAPDSVVDRR